MLFDTFHGDVDACITVAVGLMHARPILAPLLVTIHMLRMPAHRASLTRVLGISPCSRNPSERRLVSYVVLERTEGQLVQSSIHLHAVVDTVMHLFEIFKNDARRHELTGPLHAGQLTL